LNGERTKSKTAEVKMGGHNRTVEGFVRDIDHITGVKIRIQWMPFTGLYLRDEETGNTYPLGDASKKTLLEPEEQTSICRGLHRGHLLVSLGLDASEEDND
jgi:hypothetical protein